MLPILIICSFFDPSFGCANKIGDDLKKSNDKIILLENVLDANKQTIMDLEKELDSKNEELRESESKKDMYFNRWNSTNEYVKFLHEEFLRKQKVLVGKLERERTEVAASDRVLRALVEMHENQRSFFERILSKVETMSYKQNDLILASQKTNENILTVLQQVIEINQEMRSTINTYGENQKKLVNIVQNMTNDESELWGMVQSLRAVIAKLDNEQKNQIVEIIDKQDETTRMLIASVLNLISQKNLWESLTNDTLSDNIGRLNLVRRAINESMKFIQFENSTLAHSLEANFESKLEELKESINWKDGQSLNDWIQEPLVRQKIVRDLRRKALLEIEEINLDAVDGIILEEAQLKINNLRREVNNHNAKIEELMKNKIEIEEMRKEFDQINQEQKSQIDELKRHEFNITMNESDYYDINTPRMDAISSTESTQKRYIFTHSSPL